MLSIWTLPGLLRLTIILPLDSLNHLALGVSLRDGLWASSLTSSRPSLWMVGSCHPILSVLVFHKVLCLDPFFLGGGILIWDIDGAVVSSFLLSFADDTQTGQQTGGNEDAQQLQAGLKKV